MFPLFAQLNDDEAVAAVGAVLCVFLLVYLVVVILFLLTLQKALNRCSPRNRTMQPGMVWLNFIPLFNIVWQFITVARVADSLRNEFRSRGQDRGDDYGRGLGIAACVLGMISGGFNGAGDAADELALLVVAGVLGLAALGTFIAYWVKIAGYSKQIASGGYDDGGYGDYDDRDDDRRDRGRDRDDRDDGYDDGRGSRPWDRGGR